jgi:hypothetical protein
MPAWHRGVAAGLVVTMFLGTAPAARADVGAASLAPGAIFGPDVAAIGAGRSTKGASLALPVGAAGSVLEIGGLSKPRSDGDAERDFMPISAERAQILLRSLTVPGWGQATLGRDRSAAVFGLAELGVWATFAAFRIQVQLRRESSVRTAKALAGIDLSDRDEEFRRIVGSFISSDEYNQLVVYRDAANLYLLLPSGPDYEGYRKYIAEHELGSADHWQWDSEGSLLRYRAQRRNITQASQRANAMLAVAIVNRLLSALHAARVAHHSTPGAGTPRSWNLEVVPSDPNDATAYRVGVRTRF